MTLKKFRWLVVTPTLGKSPFLTETINSINYLPGIVEHIIVCPAEVRDIITTTSLSSRIVIEPIGQSGGMYSAINLGIAAAKNEYDFFCYLNDDDYFLEDISKVAAIICDMNAIYYGKTWMVDRNGKHLYLAPFSRFQNMTPLFLKDRIIPFMQPSMIIPLNIIKKLGRFDSSFRYCGDIDFILRAVYSGTVFIFLDYCISAFRLHKGQLSGFSEKMSYETGAAYGKYNLLFREKWLRRSFLKVLFTLLNSESYLQRYVSTNKLTSNGVFYD